MRRLPTTADLAEARLVLIAGLGDNDAAALAAKARAMGVLVNVEDRKPWCDFHLPGVVRRGGLARHGPCQAARGPNRMITAPIRQIATPIKSHRSGRVPSTAQSQPRAAAM